VRPWGAFQIRSDRFVAWPRVGHAGEVDAKIVMGAPAAAVRVASLQPTANAENRLASGHRIDRLLWRACPHVHWLAVSLIRPVYDVAPRRAVLVAGTIACRARGVLLLAVPMTLTLPTYRVGLRRA